MAVKQSGTARAQGGKGARSEPYFAIVVGSGFGGAVTACRLAQALASPKGQGAAQPSDILILERGRRYSSDDFPRVGWPDYVPGKDPATSKRLPDAARLLWGNDQGLWELRNLGQLRVGLAAGFGGGSLIYANVHLRPPDDVFDGWPAACAADCRCGGRGEATPYRRAHLKHYYDRVAHMLRLRPLPPELRTRIPKTVAFARAASKLTGGNGAPDPQRFLYPPLAVTFDESNGAGGDGQPAKGTCNGCGNCTIGCSEGAKNTLDRNYLAVAEKLGVEAQTLCEVQSIADRGDLLQVRYLDHRCGQVVTVEARHVFLGAGAVGSTEILLRSSSK
jgi:cholesterol oxidase